MKLVDLTVESPACTREAAHWLVDTGAKAIGFDCFPERAAKKQSYLLASSTS